jgi:hypothetical protein
MKDIEKYISPLVESQFPSFYKEEGSFFIAFVKAYYEWMEQSDQTIGQARRLFETRDIDQTIDDFLIHFKDKYLAALPYLTTGDKRLLVKHIQDLYRTKGTKQSVELLLKLLYNVDASVYYPGDDVFKVSDGEWKVPRYIEVSPDASNTRFIGKVILGTTSRATAFVERVVRKRVQGKFIDVLYISATEGDFLYNERIVLNNDPAIEGAPKVLGSLTNLTVLNGGQEFARGDLLEITGGSGRQGKALVTSISTETGRVNFKIEDGGFGYSTNAQVIVAERNLTVGNITNANTSITGFERFETIYQPLANLEYSSTANSALFANGSIIENYHSNGVVSANAVVLFNDPVDSNTGVMIISPVYGNVASDSTFSLQGNSATAVIDTYTNVTATGNVMFVSNTSLGVFNVTNVFYAYPGNYIYGGSTNTFANVSVRSSGTGARFSVGKLTNDETVLVFPDLLRANNSGNVAFMSILLDGSNSNVAANGYGFVKYTAGDINTPLQHILRQSTKTIGEISVLTGINPGENYNTDPYVYVIEPEIASLERRDIALKITTPIGLFIPDELCEMSSNSVGQQLTVSGFSGTAANGAATAAAEVGEYAWQSNGTANVATGFVNQINMSGGAGTIRLANTTGTFTTSYALNTLTTNATSTVTAANTVTIVTTAVGKVKTSNTSFLSLRRLTLNSDFIANNTILGKTSGALATIIDAAEDNTVPVMGDNAVVSANAQVANSVVSGLSVVSSGFGYVDAETVTLSKAGIDYVVTAKASLELHGASEGYYKTERGFLDSSSKVFDGDYYQDYSYEVQARLPLEKYAEVLKNVVHVSGTKSFGKVIFDSIADGAEQFVSTVASRQRDISIEVGSVLAGFSNGDPVTTTSANGIINGRSTVFVIANNQPYIEVNSPATGTYFSGTVKAVESNTSHSIIYTLPTSGGVDASNNITMVIGRTLTIDSVQQGNTVTGSFAVGETLYQSNTMGGAQTANGIVTAANSTHVTLRTIDGTWVANGTAYGTTSNAYANVASVANTTASFTVTSAINTIYLANTSGTFAAGAIAGANATTDTAVITLVNVDVDT